MLVLVKKTILRCQKIVLYLAYSALFAIKSFLLSDEKMLKTTKYDTYRRLSDISIKKYLKVKKTIETKAINQIKSKNKIGFGFVVYTGSMWFFDELYKLLDNNSKFDPYIIVGHFKMNDYSSSENEYKKTLQYFKDKQYQILSVDEISENDILLYLTPFSFFEKEINLKNLSLSHLVLHASYSYMLGGNTSKLDLNMYHWSFRYYTDSQYYLDLIRQSIKRYSGNARYYGNPKMDQYYLADDHRLSDKKTIIYAPHHSVNYTEFKAATFEDNYKFILELMKKYKDEVYWIYKPHPLLRGNCIKARVFDTDGGYDQYIEEMSSTGCVKIADSGDYYGLFKASDAMITDSVSFLAEYQFTGKPLLLLKSGQEKYNRFGQSIIDILYSCNGKDLDSIESFLKKVICGEDSMKEKRKVFFENCLDYFSAEGISANKRIFNDLTEAFGK